MTGTRDIGARLSSNPTFAPYYRPFVRAIEGKVEACGCGYCVEALDTAGSIFGLAILSTAGGSATEYETDCADLVCSFLPPDIGDVICPTGSC